jgi:hypothetical protein
MTNMTKIPHPQGNCHLLLLKKFALSIMFVAGHAQAAQSNPANSHAFAERRHSRVC